MCGTETVRRQYKNRDDRKVFGIKNIRKGFSNEEEVLKGISLAIEKVSLLPFWDLPDVERQQRCVLLQDLKCRMRDRCFWMERM